MSEAFRIYRVWLGVELRREMRACRPYPELHADALDTLEAAPPELDPVVWMRPFLASVRARREELQRA